VAGACIADWTDRSRVARHPQHCCASACVYLLEAIQVLPSSLLLDPCCKACNRWNCLAQNAQVTAAIDLRTRIAVPSMLDGYATIVSINP
jgi:hypothetical protein